MRILSFILLLIVYGACSQRMSAQVIKYGPNDTIRLGGIVIGQDTFPVVFMDEVEKHAALPRNFARRREDFNRLKYNIQRVYPYAVIAADLLKGTQEKLDQMEDKHERKAYLKSIEKELNKRFKGELQNLSITQGQILVKLISRQTGRNCFSIIKEVKGGFNAFVWQGVALLFSNNLKREYDPYDRDRDIEAIVRDLETDNYYRYQVEMQRRRVN